MAEPIKNMGVVYVVDIDEVPDFNKMYAFPSINELFESLLNSFFAGMSYTTP